MSAPANASLRAQAGALLGRLLEGYGHCALLDFQNHGNVGDSAIWLGEVAYLERAGCAIRHVCSELDYDARSLRTVVGDGPILLSGGGNFGDVWPAHQRFRERVLADFPGNRVIQLPQSIQFTKTASLERARRALGAHRDFHLLVRDRQSLDVAQGRLGIPALPCPDMVHMLDVPAFGAEPECRLLVLSRPDHEKLESPDRVLARARRRGASVADWLDQPSLPEEPRYHRARRAVRRRWLPAAPFERRALHYANVLATRRLHWGCVLLARGRAIVTDRLHACLLGWLGGRPVYFVDNSYGKLSAYVQSWLETETDIVACKDFEEALRCADEETR